MKKIININNEIEQHLKKFTDHGDFSELIRAIEYSLERKSFAAKNFFDAWDSFCAGNELDDLLEQYAQLLAKIKVIRGKADVEKLPTNPKGPKILFLDKEELVEDLRQYGEEQSDLSQRYASSYSWFKASWDLAEIMEEVYLDELNPGKVIAKYIKSIFYDVTGNDSFAFLSDYNYKPELSVLYGSELHLFIEKVGCQLIGTIHMPEEYRQAAKDIISSILDPDFKEKKADALDIDRMLIVALLMPQDIFYAWLHGWWLNWGFDCRRSPELTLSNFTDFLKYYRIGPISQPLVYQYGNVDNFIDSVLKKSTDKRISYATFSALCLKAKDEIDGTQAEPEIKKMLKNIMSDYTTFRLNYLTGMSPIEAFEADTIAQCYHQSFDFNLKNIDFTIVLSLARYADTYNFLTRYSDWVEEEATFQEFQDEYHEKEELYFNLFHKAKLEGFPELANALLSLYLFGRLICCKGRMGNSKELQGILDDALSMPGRQIVHKTISFIVTQIENYFNADPLATLSLLVLRSYAQQETSLHLLPRKGKSAAPKKQSDDENKTRLIQELGEDEWRKLSNESQSFLLSAQILWHNSHMEFGFGLKDWSGLVGYYFKAIEKELCDRLKEFCSRPEYINFCREKGWREPEKKLTLGYVVKLLLDYQQCPENLQKYLYETKLTTYKNKNLLKELRTLTFEHRNLAAHAAPYNMTQYSKLLCKLFDEGMLKTLISTLQ